jgi:hypothetical protein
MFFFIFMNLRSIHIIILHSRYKTTTKIKFVGIKKLLNFVYLQKLYQSALIKENQIFLTLSYIIQNGAVAKSYMANGLLIYGEIFGHFFIFKEALPHITLQLLPL